MAQDRAPRFYDVPAGVAPARCRLGAHCTQTIFFIRSPKDPKKHIPIDCDVDGGKRPTAATMGLGVNHFTTCLSIARRGQVPEGVTPQTTVPDLPPKPPTCILCGCTRDKPCTVAVPDADRHEDEQMELPRYTTCTWLQLDPPICNAPECVKQRADLPPRLRLGKSILAGVAE